MKKLNFPNENGYGVPLLILTVLNLFYIKLLIDVSVLSSKSLFENYPIEIILSITLLLFSIIFSLKYIFESFKNKNLLGIGTFIISIFILIIVFSPISNSPNLDEDKEKECREPDDTGNYMNRVLDELNDKGYGISGYYFGGNGFYNVTVIKPTGTIGSSEVEVLVNECGEILRIIE